MPRKKDVAVMGGGAKVREGVFWGGMYEGRTAEDHEGGEGLRTVS